MIRSKVIWFMSVLLILTLIAACSSNGNKPSNSESVSSPNPSPTETVKPTATAKPQAKVTLKFFTGKVETVDLMNELIEKFEAANPEINVEQEYQKDASNVIKVKFASGDIPDITTVYSQDYVDQGKYLDLSNEAFWSRVLPAIKELNTDIKTGKQFRAATNVTMAGIFYNKRVFEELGLKEAHTWAEFKSNLQTIKDKKPDMTPMFIAGKDSWTLGHLIEFMAHGVTKQQFGVTEARTAFINNDASKLQFDAAGGGIDTFGGRLLELKEAGLINNDALTATYDNQKEAFVTGKSALFSQGMWVLGDLLKLNPHIGTNIGFSPFPAIVDGTKPVTLSAEDSVYAITSESKHPDEAKKFLEFLFEPDNLKQYSEFLKSPPAFTDVSADWGPLKNQAAAALKSGVNIAFTDTPSGFSGDDAGRMVQELLAGKYKSSSEFASAYKAAWDKAWGATNK
ncbi:extracellular solute-binding protein [Paenibacillus sp. GSMTC-2017]|uniref:ABC transporter substrate-binding protein n=1 Tax=Paenibacillus sp. GSMTC-2017 TaxID=2794350 RepID=UPI0018D5E181|nr:extracellular solute-binding protein [Paenibacillus sp. GSMTC-2017]MBH5320406.1 extracellular solute-binding protein [Paenibacillus sp. GSMTC-2017]